MAPELHQRVREIFDRALERPEAERNAFVERACAGDAMVRGAVERLLRARGAAASFLETTELDTSRIGRYLIQRELGRGAMGIVYDAIDPIIGRRVAVKVISLKAGVEPGQAEFMKERLFREARSAGSLFHPGIVLVFDVGVQGDSAFITMERVEGQTVQQLLAGGGALSPKTALSILKQTAAALDHAHQFGVVHRDIKPANIMLQGDITVKVADFGIAKLMTTQNATITGLLMGTPSYMSPEQIEARSVDGKSDQFSLAVLGYELFTGARPFEADSMPTLAHLIVYGLRPSARAANAALPSRIDSVLERALSRFPEQRFPSCSEFTAALESVFEEPLAGGKMPAAGRLNVARASLYVGGLAVLVLALLVAPATKTPYFRKRLVPFMAPTQVAAKSEVVPTGRRPAPTPAAPQQVVSLTSAKVFTAKLEPESQSSAAVLKPKPVIPVSKRAQQFYRSALEKRAHGKPEEAFALFRQAAALGDANAMEEMAESYSAGEGVPKDGLAALQWFMYAEAAGNSEAMVQLGALYSLGGDPVPDQSDREAVRWYQKAADLKNPAGMYDLGGLYENGQGVARDLEKAQELYREAAALGNLLAQKRLAELETQK